MTDAVAAACTQCGGELAPKAAFCHTCGAPRAAPIANSGSGPSQTPPPPKSDASRARHRPFVVVSIALVAVVLIAVWATRANDGQRSHDATVTLIVRAPDGDRSDCSRLAQEGLGYTSLARYIVTVEDPEGRPTASATLEEASRAYLASSQRCMFTLNLRIPSRSDGYVFVAYFVDHESARRFVSRADLEREDWSIELFRV